MANYQLLFKGAYNPGDSGGGGTPVPIPNTEVKPSSADDTLFGESRSSPGLCASFFIDKVNTIY